MRKKEGRKGRDDDDISAKTGFLPSFLPASHPWDIRGERKARKNSGVKKGKGSRKKKRG